MTRRCASWGSGSLRLTAWWGYCSVVAVLVVSTRRSLTSTSACTTDPHSTSMRSKTWRAISPGPKASVTRPGEWGSWVDGGGWLYIGGTAVDWIYRGLDCVLKSWEDARAGRYDFHFQIGHPFGVPDFMYAGEVALGVVLADPSGEITALQKATRRYPPLLRDALVAGLREASFDIDIARKGVTRGDTAYVGGCLFRIVEVCAHALHGHAEHWLINE